MRFAVFAFLTVAMGGIGVALTTYGLLLAFGRIRAVVEDRAAWDDVLLLQEPALLLTAGGVFLIGAVIAYVASERP